jgi:hypothetical protein
MPGYIQRRGGGSGVNLDTVEWQPDSSASGLQFIPSMTTGDCMMYVVARTTKVASHYIANIDTNVGTSNPGLALRYWQPTDSWFAYCNVASNSGNVSTSAAGTAAGAKVLLGIRVSGATFSISVNGAVTTGGVATAFTATRAILNHENSANLTAVDDSYTVVGYSDVLAQRIEGFLADKHGITLANGHPYRSATPTYAWRHSDDPGLKVWYDFADSSTVTITGAGISNLLNKAASGGYTLTQSTDAYRPTWDGSKATGRATGAATTSGLAITTTVSWTNAAYMTMYTAALGTSSGASSGNIWNARTAGERRHGEYLQSGVNTLQARTQTSAGTNNNVESYTPSSDFNIRGLVWSGIAAGAHTPYKNGTAFSAYSNASNGNNTGDVFSLLREDTDTHSLGSFLVTSSTSTETRLRHEGAMAWDKELQTSLPLDHPYRSRRPIYQEWFPSDDPGLLIWYDFADASTITITGAGISQITNKVGGGTYTLAQATDSNRPSWDGARATSRGTGSGLAITTTVGWTNAAYNTFATVSATAFDSTNSRLIYNVLSAGANHHSYYAKFNANNLRHRASPIGTGAGELDFFVGYTPGTTYIVNTSFDGSTTKGSYVNGTVAQTDTSANNGAISGAEMRILSAGAGVTLGDFIVTSSTTTAIRQKHEGYLAWKRGLAASLDASHPYKTRPPLTTD